MNGSWDYLNDQINRMVQGTLNSENIKELNDKITNTVNHALEEAMGQVRKVSDDLKDFHAEEGRNRTDHTAPPPPRTAKAAPPPNGFRYVRVDKIRNSIQGNRHIIPPPSYNPAVRMNHVGGVSGILYIVFGGIGLGMMSLFTLSALVVYLLGLFPIPAGLILGTGLSAALSGLMLRLGIGKRRRLKRAAEYLKLCGNRTYINIKELAQMTGKSSRSILKDIKHMIRLRIYPEGHLDHQNTCLMLNQNIYSQYLKLEEERRIREAEEAEALKIPAEARNGQAQETKEVLEAAKKPKELDTLASQGKEYVRQLRELNDEIEGEVISTKLFRTESLLEEMFYRVETHPGQIKKTQRLMEYYLPMTIKLVRAYRDFDRISTPDQEILSAKAEIEKTLDTINRAFGEILNSLYRDAALDVTTDAQVLQSMMAREGLTDEMRRHSEQV